MIQVHVQLFAAAREISGSRELVLILDDGATTGDMLQALIAKYRQLAEWKSVLRVAVNQEYTTLTIPLRDGDHVAIIPPVSGG